MCVPHSVLSESAAQVAEAQATIRFLQQQEAARKTAVAAAEHAQERERLVHQQQAQALRQALQQHEDGERIRAEELALKHRRTLTAAEAAAEQAAIAASASAERAVAHLRASLRAEASRREMQEEVHGQEQQQLELQVQRLRVQEQREAEEAAGRQRTVLDSVQRQATDQAAALQAAAKRVEDELRGEVEVERARLRDAVARERQSRADHDAVGGVWLTVACGWLVGLPLRVV